MRPTIVEVVGTSTGLGFLVPGYDLMLALAVVLAFHLALREAERQGLDVGRVLRAGILTALVAWLSARLFVIATHAADYAERPLDILEPWKGGTGSTGLYAGGFVAAVLAARWQRLSPARFLDCCAPAVAAGLVIGRLACFLNGCCYGRVTGLPWAVRFPEGSDPQVAHLAGGLILPGDPSLPVHPVQLYEAGFGLVVLAILWRRRDRPVRDGTRIATFFLLYAPVRFFIEFLRGDPRAVVGALTVPQGFSLVVLATASAFLLYAQKRARRPGGLEALP